jgi:hypothetical protein
MVGWICFQLLRRLGAEAHPVVTKWIYNSLSSGELEPTALAFYAAVVVATQRQHGAAISEFAAADAILLTLRIRMGDSQEASRSLAEALQYLAGILRNDTDRIVDWGTESGSATLVWLIKTLSRHAPLLAKASDPEVRASLAILLWNLTTWQEDFPPVLAEILTQLGSDARARVRLNAAGGIHERRRQAEASEQSR